MTTIDAAATSHLCKKVVLAALATVLAVGLTACGTSNNILGGGGDTSPSLAQQPTAPPAHASSRIAIAPVIGAPDAVAKQITAQLTKELEQNRVAVSKAPTDPADYTLRGYVVAAKEKAGTKVSYIWDLTDPSGKRVNRITGEELASGGDARDPWAAVTPTIMQSISSKTASQLGTWLSSQPQSSAAVATAPTATPAAMSASAPAPTATAAVATAPPSSTGSIGREEVLSAIVPSVTGAPGDGAVSLTTAIQRELSRNGVSLAEQATAKSYRIEGKVKLGQSKDGKQPIQIDWFVKDPQGKQVGTVSQKNEIPEGSLNGTWGKVADAAAAAAAQGILKLLPKATATN